MVFTRFVEVGRVVLVNYGPLTGKLAVVVEIISTNRVLLEGPTTGVRRQEMSLRRVKLTDVTVPLKRGAKSAAVRKAVTDAKIAEKFANTSQGRRHQRTLTRESLTDFQRFQVMVLKRRRRNLTVKTLHPRK